MSFAGGSGHKSPFAERAKATKSHLSPRRSSTASAMGTSRNAQQSLFGKEWDSSAKVGQIRNAQPDVKEPTTPTRASEGSAMKGNRHDEFSSFNSRRVGTPIKTPRTAFGTAPPRSPKRPYMGSPKYQKVLLERPAFYNSPAAGEPTPAETGRKEVSISELQKRLKRFLQDENAPSPSQLEVDEVPYNISRSPRVNPLFHHDDTLLHVAKGGVAFTAGVTEMQTRPGGVAFTAGVADTIDTNDSHVCAPLPETMLPETSSPQCIPGASATEALSVVETPSPIPQCIPEASRDDTEALCCEDFPVHSEDDYARQVEKDGSQIEEERAEDVCIPPSAFSAPELGSNTEELEKQENSSIVEVQGSEGEIVVNSCVHEALEAHANVEDEQRAAGAAVEHECETDCIPEEETEVLESWSQRFLKFVVLAVVVACVMGIMVLASGSQGLLPESLHSTSVTGAFGSSPLRSSVIPVSIGFMGLGREHEGMQCLPAVHLGLKCLSSTSNVGASRHEGSSSSDSYDTSSVTMKDSKLADVVVDTEQLKTVTDYYKELQGRLFSDVASLTGETALSDASGMEGGQFPAMEHISEIGVLDDVAQVAGTEDVTEVAATEVVSEVVAIQVVEELVATEDVSELVNEIVEELQLETLSSSDEDGREDFEIAPNLEQIILDTTTELETHQLPADVKLEALIPVNHLSENELHVVPTTSIDTTDATSSVLRDSEIGSELEEVTPSVSMEESAFNDIPAEETSLLNVPPVFTDENPSTSPVTDEDIISATSLNVEDLVEDEEPQPQSTTEVVDSSDLESAREVSNSESKVVVSEESVLYEGEVQGFYPLATIGLLVVALALALSFLLKSQKTVPKGVTLASAIQAETAAELNAFPGSTATAQFKAMSSPVAWPATRSVYDSHIPDRDELDAITSPLRSFRAHRNLGGLESFSTKYASVEPALSAPGLFQPRARVEQRPATTWHPAMRAGSNTISSSGYRQTASYVPTIPSESGISTSTRGTSDVDSVCESALTMGAEEWEHLGSFTTTELVSVSEIMSSNGEASQVMKNNRTSVPPWPLTRLGRRAQDSHSSTKITAAPQQSVTASS